MIKPPAILVPPGKGKYEAIAKLQPLDGLPLRVSEIRKGEAAGVEEEAFQAADDPSRGIRILIDRDLVPRGRIQEVVIVTDRFPDHEAILPILSARKGP